MSAFGTKRTSRPAQPMSAFGGKADIAYSSPFGGSEFKIEPRDSRCARENQILRYSPSTLTLCRGIVEPLGLRCRGELPESFFLICFSPANAIRRHRGRRDNEMLCDCARVGGAN